MTYTLNIYLSGSIRKGKNDHRTEINFWTQENEETVRGILDSPIKLLNPSKSNISRNDYFVNFGCDLYLIKSAHVVLADLRTEKGVGVGAELMYAHHHNIPVVGWAPPNSYYRRDHVEDVFGEDLEDWIHPFVFGLCDYLAEDLETACQKINELAAGRWQGRGAEKSSDNAIAAFLKSYPDSKL